MTDILVVNKDWFEEKLAGDINAQELVAVLIELAEAGRTEDAATFAEMLTTALSERGDIDQLLPVIKWQVVQGTISDVKTVLTKKLGKNRKAKKMVEPAGFGTRSIDEAITRFKHLQALKVGMQCYNKTWGFGVIDDVDYYYQQVIVDFERKGDHEMAFSYAAEALETLSEDHLLYIKHNDPDTMQELLTKKQAELVRVALSSYGSMSVPMLQQTLEEAGVVTEAGWKKFWEAARRELKNDASVEIPKKRSEAIVLHVGGLAYDDSWIELKVAGERDIEKLFKQFQEIIDREIDCTSETAQSLIADRLAFIIKGAPSAHPEWPAMALLFSDALGVAPAGIDMDELTAQFISGDLITILERLPSKKIKSLLAMLLGVNLDAVSALLSQVIPVVSITVLSEIMAALIENGAEDDVKALMFEAVGKRTCSSPMLLWVQRSPKYVEKWSLISKANLAFRIQEVLEVNSGGIMLRAQNQLRDRFQQEEWLADVMDAMTEQQRRDFLRRANEGLGWEALDRKSLVGKILRKYPNLSDVILGPGGGAAPKKREVPMTSTRSFVEKQKQLEHIMKVEIPENSKEIELARSYGDLRENAEFKYAKERQGLLMAQSAQLAEDLEKVRPTDYADVGNDEVVGGTGAELVFPDGSVEIYYILGAWDQDDELNIISSDTRLALSLMYHEAGDEVEVPAGKCTLKAVLPLSPEVKAWIKG